MSIKEEILNAVHILEIPKINNFASDRVRELLSDLMQVQTDILNIEDNNQRSSIFFGNLVIKKYQFPGDVEFESKIPIKKNYQFPGNVEFDANRLIGDSDNND